MKTNKILGVRKSSFIEGSVIATLSIIIVKVLGLVYVIPFYALVGSAGSALYAYAYNIYVIFLDISTAGIPVSISKLISEYSAVENIRAKEMVYKVGMILMGIISIVLFLILFFNSSNIALLLLGNLEGGNSVSDVSFVIKCVSFALLIVPFLSVSKGYLQGHKIINISSISQVIEQVIRILIILIGSYLIIRVFRLDVKYAVGIYVFAAFLGALIAFLYVYPKIREYRSHVKCEFDNVLVKEIARKILKYAFPYIVINIISSCYNFIDMTILLRILDYLGYSANNVEFIASAISTWSTKISMIVTSFSSGMIISLIPTIATSYALRKIDDVNNKFNQALQIIIFISLPCTLIISALSTSIWTVFYGFSYEGGIILCINIFTGFLLNVYMVVSSVLQSLNKFKLVYLMTFTGFFTNAILDIPLIFLFDFIGIPSYLGVCISSIIGYLVSISIALFKLKKEFNFNYDKVFTLLKELIMPISFMFLSLLICKILIPVSYDDRVFVLMYVFISSSLSGIIYLLLCLKKNIFDEVFGLDFINRVIKKLTFEEVSVKEN